jgi:methionine-S-sulfoxide reductase
MSVSFRSKLTAFLFALVVGVWGESSEVSVKHSEKFVENSEREPIVSTDLDTLVVGGGCFWCLEALFEQLRGVRAVESGYAGGHLENPDYKSVCAGVTGHAEVVRVIYDPSMLTTEVLLRMFFHIHNPTTLNRQGNDVGTQYRSIVLFKNEQQKVKAEQQKELVEKEKLWENPLVTEISPLRKFYPAEEYHQDYFEKNPTQGYCSIVIAPKVRKFRKEYKDLLKEP